MRSDEVYLDVYLNVGMPSHLTSIGFPAVSKEDVMAVIQKAAREGLPIPSRKGEYVLWAPGGGPEL